MKPSPKYKVVFSVHTSVRELQYGNSNSHYQPHIRKNTPKSLTTRALASGASAFLKTYPINEISKESGNAGTLL